MYDQQCIWLDVTVTSPLTPLASRPVLLLPTSRLFKRCLLRQLTTLNQEVVLSDLLDNSELIVTTLLKRDYPAINQHGGCRPAAGPLSGARRAPRCERDEDA